MPSFEDHPLRYALANELHARPFPTIDAPARVAFLAIKRLADAAGRSREADRAHLVALLDRHGASHPQPGATHYFGPLGKYQLKWECHTEFVTYTLFGAGAAAKPFDAETFAAFPEDWLAQAPGVRMTSVLLRVEVTSSQDEIRRKLDNWFVAESLASSEVLDGDAIVAGDFRIDPSGHMRMALFVGPEISPRRTGRIVQRLCEIETYKTMSMLGLARARGLADRMGALDAELSGLSGDMCGDIASPDAMLKQLLNISAELENMIAKSTFRFGASFAYEALVSQRIAVLREARFEGRQTFAEFMARRFDPAMRTVKATETRLQGLAAAAQRAAELLRTRVDVERSAQNQRLLESMDRRADLQLRLQKTVEGLSVVAISYYAMNLIAYMLYPLAARLALSSGMLTAALTPLVVLGVWLAIRRIRRSVG